MTQILAILWCQWRTLRNFYSSGRARGVAATLIIGGLWYAFWVCAALAAGILCAGAMPLEQLRQAAPAALLLSFIYWQIFPIMMASSGAHLDVKKLLAYPIDPDGLFFLETLLRVTTAVEMVIVTAAAAIGLLLNRQLPWWAPIGLAVFVVFNLYLSTGVKQLLTRLLERRFARELMVIGLVLLSVLPQFLVLGRIRPVLEGWIVSPPKIGLLPPWSAAGAIASGNGTAASWAILLAWTAAAAWFARDQFARTMRFDADAARGAKSDSVRANSLDRIFQLPASFLPDPLATLVELELRFLSRAPRFRMIMLMACLFGPMIFLPQTLGRQSESFARANFLTMVSLYSILIVSENLFWNSFGFERAAVQTFFVTPIRFSSVLIAKNIAAVCYCTLVIAMLSLICLALRMPTTARTALEAAETSAVVILFLLSAGNISSVRQPRGVDPGQTWRSYAPGRAQLTLLVVYPILAIPISLAYMARYAFDSQWAFHAVILFDLALASLVYWIALESAVAAAEIRKEEMIGALLSNQGPIAA